MPELPEVETVRSGLEVLLKDSSIKSIKLLRPNLRNTIPTEISTAFKNQPIISIRRRAKYLLIDTPKKTILSHLGMTGSWRILEYSEPEIHDHCIINLKDGRQLVYNDPRRFGILDYMNKDSEEPNKWLSHLGPEPLDIKSFNGNYLKEKVKNRKMAIKGFIMDQKVVVGVGNIYASEALFRSGIRPTKASFRVSQDKCNLLVKNIRIILREAIKAGGSTVKDFKQAGGHEGFFQNKLRVYGRNGEKCLKCKSKIKSKLICGRNSFWCPTCQA